MIVPTGEKIIRKNMTNGDSLYVTNINQSVDRFTVIGSGYTSNDNLLERPCF